MHARAVKHLGANTQLFRPWCRRQLFQVQAEFCPVACLKKKTEIISFAWVSCLSSFVLESIISITACAVFKGWKMCQLSKWLRTTHQRNRLLDWGTFKRSRSQEILNCTAGECWNWKPCASASGHWDHCRVATNPLLTSLVFLQNRRG